MASPQRMIVTGAAQGIGRAVALRLAAHGVHLAVWDVQRNGVEETAKLCREKGAASRAFTVDVGDADAIEAAVAVSSGNGASPTASSTTPESFHVRGRSTWTLRNGSRCCAST